MNLKSRLKPAGIACSLTGLLFLFSGVAKLLPLSAFEFQLVRDGLASWALVPFLSRGLIIGELSLGLCLTLQLNLRRLIIPAAGALLLFFSIYLFISLLTTGIQANCGCFGQVLPMSTLSALLKNIVLLAVLAFSWRKVADIPVSIPALAIPLVICFFSVLLFFPARAYHQPETSAVIPEIIRKDTVIQIQLRPGQAYMEPSKPKLAAEARDTNHIPTPREEKFTSVYHRFETYNDGLHSPDEGNVLLALLSLDCDHCLHTATEIARLQQQQHFPRVLILFLGEQTEVPAFLSNSGIKGAYQCLGPADFFPLLQKNPPRVVLLRNGAVQQDWDGDSFSPEKLTSALHDRH